MAFIFQFFLFLWILFIPMKTVIYQASYIIMFILIVFHIYINKTFNDLLFILHKLKDILFILLCIIASMTVSNALSEFSTFTSWKVEFTYIYRYIFASIVLLYAYQQRLFDKKTLVIFIVFSLFVQSAIGIYHFSTNFDSLKNGISAWTHNRNTFGMLMTLGSSIIIGILLHNRQYKLRKLEYFLLVLTLIFFLFNLLFSYSRASWLASLIFIITMWIFNFKTISLKKYFLVVCFFTICIILFLMIPELASRFKCLIELDSSNRFEIWKHTLSLILQKPFLGYGLHSYAHIGLKNIAGVHNAILEILLYLGIFGFIFYTTLIAKIIKEQINQKNFFFLAISISLMTINQFDHSITSGIVTLSPLSIFAFFIFEKRISHE